MKKHWLVPVLGSLVALSTACSGGTGGTPAAAGTSAGKVEAVAKKVELRVMWWGDQKRADLTNQMLKKFEEKYPNIKVTSEFSPVSGYFDKLNTQLASQTAPDVFTLGSNLLDYANKEVLLDLNPYVGNALNTADIDKTLLDYTSSKGKLYGVSIGANARSIIANTELFKKAGMPIPQDGWTWDDYAKVSKEVSQKLGKDYYGSYNFTSDYNAMEVYFRQNGKIVYDNESGKLGFEAKDAEAWFAYWDNLSKGGGLVTPELQVSASSLDTSKSLVVTGKAAMSFVPSNLMKAMQGSTKDKLALLQVPRGAKGTGLGLDSSQGISAYAKTKYPKEAAMLINFWVNDPDAVKILGNDRGIPVSSKMRDVLKQNADATDQQIYDYIDRVSAAAKKEPVKPSYNIPGYNEFSKLLETTGQQIAFGKKDVKKSADELFTGTQQILSKNK
ncbi:sugar ABC transporter substrate-binding protein [Paenibacillus sp. GP183]|uniref:ABC transporter substrate-binding protein n=1 Tax=Paenibacillus sp. GP183 TaxID=1882751 RepID=UPI00089BDFA4|nr:sugar ABC transporter substrate-binding protein [Paenibacillus sp. GP183]SED07751.1 carbohydrate ABC transporter substrate-binding protein, CUT1 family [Paenibacillus sp. GP183]